jgi:tetratricopeptide (TPR) repeat protein
LVAALVLFLLPAARPAYAADSGRSADPAKAAALAHFEAAKRLFDVREYGRALEEYKEAYLAKPDPAFLFNIAQCHRKLGQNTQALDFYQQFLRKAPLDDPNRRQVEARIADIQAEEQEKARAAAKPEPAPAAAPAAAPAPTPVSAPVPEPAPASPTPAPAPAPTPAPLPEAAAPLPSATPAGADLSLATPATPAPEARPLYAKWWFWAGVGAVVAAGTVTTIYLASSGGGTKVPSTSLGNRPVFP